MSEDVKIFEFAKNACEKVIIKFFEFDRKELVDIRVFRGLPGFNEEWRPTRKGISMSRKLLPVLKEGIDKAYSEWDKHNN